jgi:hypothetical protein
VSAEGWFSVASALVLPGWALMILAPRWRWTQRLVAANLLPLLLAAGSRWGSELARPAGGDPPP